MTKNPSTIFIDKEYLSMVPRPSDEQRHVLKESIKKDGLLNPIIVNQDGKVIDGHTRYEICSELNIIPSIEVRKFSNINEERMYVKTTNYKRRQLTSFQMIEGLEAERKLMMVETRSNANQLLSDVKSGKREKLTKEEHMQNKTEYKIAEMIGTGVTTVDKAHYILRHGTEAQKQRCRDKPNVLESVYREIVNQRHKNNSENIRNTRTFPVCKKCGGKTRFKGKCHVHKKYCCKNCEYGE